MRLFSRSYILLILFSSGLCESCNSTNTYEWNQNSYRLMYQAKSWKDAKDICKENDSSLAAPESEEEFLHLQKIVRNMNYRRVVGSEYKLLVWLGISRLDDNKTWRNVDGENIEDAGFHTWAGNYNDILSDDPRDPHCAGMDAVNIGLRDYWCHRRQPYICKINT